MDRAITPGLLSGFTLFRELSDTHLALVASQSRALAVQRGQRLFHRGDPAHGLFLLLEGQIKLAVTSPQGMEKVICIIKPGESFGDAVIFLDRPVFPVSAQATEDSSLLVVPKRVIFELLESDHSVACKMLAGLSVYNRQLVQQIEAIALLTCSQRFIGYLLQVADASDTPDHVMLPASKTNIASLLNLAPETLSRTMLKLQQAGLIEMRGKEIFITDVAGLREFRFGG